MNNKNTLRQSETDWERLRNMKDEDIDLSDCPEATPEMFARAVIRKNFKPVLPTSQENLIIDRDVIEFFKAQGRDYPAKINQLLRAYMEAEQAK